MQLSCEDKYFFGIVLYTMPKDFNSRLYPASKNLIHFNASCTIKQPRKFRRRLRLRKKLRKAEKIRFMNAEIIILILWLTEGEDTSINFRK